LDSVSQGSSRPRLITTVEKPEGKPCIYTPFWRGKLLTTYAVPAEEMHDNIIGALKSHYRNHQLAPAYWSQFRARIQLCSKLLQEFAAAISSCPTGPLSGCPRILCNREVR
jgi:hypothetical protein